jgi:hypothetical protein
LYAGHVALASFAKGSRPRIPIALLVPVAFAPDWIEWIFSAFGHQNREISHSLISVGAGATVVALAYYAVTRASADTVAVWLTYVSHWPADFVTGLKPTWPGGPTVGLNLYSRPGLDFAVESVIVVLCWIAYRRSLPPVARKRAVSLLIPAGLIAMQIAFFAIGAGRGS